MKKDRNSFFAYDGFNNQMNPNMMGMPQAVSSNSNFYAGPMPGNNLNPNMYSDIDVRLSKIEREINRLDTRVSRLEGTSMNPTTTTKESDLSFNNTMYMV